MRKPLLESCQRLWVGDVKCAIPSRATGAVLTIGAQEIAVIGRQTNLRNGFRYCFLCPQCNKAYESLYAADLGSWGCRVCTGGECSSHCSNHSNLT